MLPIFCCRTNPRLASVHKQVSLRWSKYDRTGAEVSDFLTAVSNSSFQVNSCFVLRSGRNSASNVAILGVLADSWFTRLMKDRRSVRLPGVGNSAIVWIMDGSI